MKEYENADEFEQEEMSYFENPQEESDNFSIIPRSILYDLALSNSEKILFAIISMHGNGIRFYHNNKFLSTMHDCSIWTIRKSLSNLSKNGHIHIQYKKFGSEVRRIINYKQI